MSDHKCNTCFYKWSEKDCHPCSLCDGYNKYVRSDVFDDMYDKESYMKEAGMGVITKPQHYTKGKFEVIDVIEDWDLNFRLANTVKYIARHKHKGKPLEDLKKAMWYLQREIDRYGETK